MSLKADDPAAPTDITMTINTTMQTKDDNKVINNNDKMGSLYIYNANGEGYKLNKDYKMAVTLKSSDEDLTFDMHYN